MTWQWGKVKGVPNYSNMNCSTALSRTLQQSQKMQVNLSRVVQVA